MTDKEKFCNKRCATNPCKHICDSANSYLAGLEKGREESLEGIKQIESVSDFRWEENQKLKVENEELKAQIHDLEEIRFIQEKEIEELKLNQKEQKK